MYLASAQENYTLKAHASDKYYKEQKISIEFCNIEVFKQDTFSKM